MLNAMLKKTAAFVSSRLPLQHHRDGCEYQIIKVVKPVKGLQLHQMYKCKRRLDSPFYFDRFFVHKQDDILILEKRVNKAIEEGALEIVQKLGANNTWHKG